MPCAGGASVTLDPTVTLHPTLCSLFFFDVFIGVLSFEVLDLAEQGARFFVVSGVPEQPDGVTQVAFCAA